MTLGLGVAGMAAAAALIGKDYVVERNLLPALVPLASAAAIGFGSERARRLGLVLALVLCVYWLASTTTSPRPRTSSGPTFAA